MKRLSSFNGRWSYQRMLHRILLCVVGCALFVSPQFSLGYDRPLPVDEKFQTAKQRSTARKSALSVLKGTRKFDDRGKAVVQSYYLRYFWPAMSNYADGAEPANPPRLEEDEEPAPVPLAELRLQLYTDLAAARSPEARDYLVKLTYARAKAYAEKKTMHPAVRYNAVLIIGDLTEGNADRGAPPVPLEASLRQLVQWMTDAKQPDFIKMGALIGVTRHAQLRTMEGAPQPLTDKLQKGLLSIAGKMAASKCPTGRDARSHIWMQRRSVELLGLLGKQDLSGGIARGLNAILSNEELDLELRCAATESIGVVNFKASRIPPAKISENLMSLVADCTTAEVDSARELLIKYGAGAGGGGGYGDGGRRPPPRPPRGRDDFGDGYADDGLGGGLGEEENADELIVFSDPLTIDSRRRLITRLQKIRTAAVGDEKKILGLSGSLPPDTLKDVVEQLDLVMEDVKEGESTLKTYARALKSRGLAMADLLPRKAAVAPDAPAAAPASGEAAPAAAAGVPVATPPQPVAAGA